MPAHTITPPPQWGTQFTKLTLANGSLTQRHTHCLPFARYRWNRIHLWREHFSSMPVAIEVGYDAEQQSGQDPGEEDKHAEELPWDDFCQFVQKLCSCENPVSSAVLLAGLRRSCRWRSQIWKSWAGEVTLGLRLWGQLGVLPNSLKWCWRWLMVEKWTFNSLATALVDIQHVRDICGIVLCDKTAHFWVAFYCPQHKVHLCNDHAV